MHDECRKGVGNKIQLPQEVMIVAGLVICYLFYELNLESPKYIKKGFVIRANILEKGIKGG